MWGEDDQVEDIEFSRSQAYALFAASRGEDPHIYERRIRIKEEVEFVDVVRMLVDGSASPNGKISCPFHGRDSSPSFQLYRGSNDGWCYGCPPGEQLYDHAAFVKAFYGFTLAQAVTWLERKFKLPPLEFESEEEVEDDGSDVEIVHLNFYHLAEPFIEKAVSDFRRDFDTERARDYIRIFFASVPGKDADPNSEEELLKALNLARVLGSTAVEKIKKDKLG